MFKKISYFFLFCLVCLFSDYFLVSAQESIVNDKDSKIFYQKFPVINSIDNYHHVVILDYADSNEICFKSYVGLNHEIGARNTEGKLLKEFKSQNFLDLIKDKNIKWNGQNPRLIVNADYVNSQGQPLDINFVQGYNYSGFRNWTSMAIDQNNNITFIREKTDNLYNVVGGGPRLSVAGQGYTLPTQETLGTYAYYRNPRTIIAITDQQRMIIVVSDSLRIKNIDKFLTYLSYRYKLGQITDANMFDGGNSPSLAYDFNNNGVFEDNDIVRSGINELSSALLIYTKSVCQFDQ